jgi:MoxR-like ATPase
MPEIIQKLRHQLNQIVVGQSAAIVQALVALLCGGHIILEGVPGTGKTLLVKVLARSLRSDFRRVQLTPDILPSDILGTNIFDLNSRNFVLKKGPIFTEILLADEINRTPPKTQSALLEAMEERQVTLDGETLPLSPLFWVAATQNPVVVEGTYPLPEAQLDRFLFKIRVGYPDTQATKQMLRNFQANPIAQQVDWPAIAPVASVEEILALRQQVHRVTVDDKILDYAIAAVEKTRQHPDLLVGASPRAAVAWIQASKARAWLGDRDYVLPDDLKAIAIPLLCHRLILRPESQLDGLSVEAVVNALLQQIPVPR